MFVRNKRSVHLTDAGRALLADAESLVEDAARFKDRQVSPRKAKPNHEDGIGMGSENTWTPQ